MDRFHIEDLWRNAQVFLRIFGESRAHLRFVKYAAFARVIVQIGQCAKIWSLGYIDCEYVNDIFLEQISLTDYDAVRTPLSDIYCDTKLPNQEIIAGLMTEHPELSCYYVRGVARINLPNYSGCASETWISSYTSAMYTTSYRCLTSETPFYQPLGSVKHHLRDVSVSERHLQHKTCLFKHIMILNIQYLPLSME